MNGKKAGFAGITTESLKCHNSNIVIDRVLDSVNAALSRCEAGKVTSRVGGVSLTKSTASFTESVSTRYTGQREIGLEFDAFDKCAAQMAKHFRVKELPIPEMFHAWLLKHVAVPEQG